MARVGTGREYTVKWTDESKSTVPSTVMFGAFTPHHRLDRGDHVLAGHADHFSPATVVREAHAKTGKLTLKFTDESTRYVTLRYVITCSNSPCHQGRGQNFFFFGGYKTLIFIVE